MSDELIGRAKGRLAEIKADMPKGIRYTLSDDLQLVKELVAALEHANRETDAAAENRQKWAMQAIAGDKLRDAALAVLDEPLDPTKYLDTHGGRALHGLNKAMDARRILRGGTPEEQDVKGVFGGTILKAMEIYEDIVDNGGEINNEEDNYAAGWAHGTYKYHESLRGLL